MVRRRARHKSSEAADRKAAPLFLSNYAHNTQIILDNTHNTQYNTIKDKTNTKRRNEEASGGERD